MSLISIKNMDKTYEMGGQSVYALRDLSLDIEKNEYLAITGPSGSGKSTLMNMLGCLDKPCSGTYTLTNHEVYDLSDAELTKIRSREVGFIFQSFNLLNKLNAVENVMLPLLYQKESRKQARKKAVMSLIEVGLGKRLDHFPNQLSGGQRQRVAIARALITKPSIILADEPTGNLDSSTSRDIMRLLDGLVEKGNTVIMVTHDNEIAERCHRVVKMKDGQIENDCKR